MLKNIDFITARNLLINAVQQISTEKIHLENCIGRVLAEDIVAAHNVPPFDRSPYDGYALRSIDVINASESNPVKLKVIEEVPAGSVPTSICTKNTAVKILTGAPIPMGADCVIMYEKTKFTDSTVSIFNPIKSGNGIVKIGEDVKRGKLLVEKGQIIDAGIIGTMASQGIVQPLVYRRPKVGIISTGNEVLEPNENISAGKIYNSNRYILSALLNRIGCDVIYLGKAGDNIDDITELIKIGMDSCDGVLSSGGVSAGDYDLTPDAMEQAGIEILFQGVKIKPGMACSYGIKDGKVYCGLSGNPVSAMINLELIGVPALKKMAGYKYNIPEFIDVRLKDDFDKKSPVTRFLCGKLEFENGNAVIKISKEQGNVVISSAIGCNMLAMIPAGYDCVKSGEVLKGFLI